MMKMKDQLIKRLTTYAKVDTQSNENSDTVPTTEGQRTLAEMLVQELKDIGMKDVTIDENSYVMATLPANTDKDVKTRSEEHTSELQSRGHLVCRLLLEKKK